MSKEIDFFTDDFVDEEPLAISVKSTKKLSNNCSKVNIFRAKQDRQ